MYKASIDGHFKLNPSWSQNSLEMPGKIPDMSQNKSSTKDKKVNKVQKVNKSSKVKKSSKGQQNFKQTFKRSIKPQKVN